MDLKTFISLHNLYTNNYEKKLFIFLSFFCISFYVIGKSPVNTHYFNNNIILSLSDDYFYLEYNKGEYNITISEGNIIKQKASFICIDAFDGRLLKLKMLDKYRLKITDLNDYNLQINARNWFTTEKDSLLLLRIKDLINSDILKLGRKKDNIYIWDNDTLSYIFDDTILYNAKTKEKMPRIKREKVEIIGRY